MAKTNGNTTVVVSDGTTSNNTYTFSTSLPGYCPPYTMPGNNPCGLYCGRPQCQIPAPLPAPVYDDPAYIQNIILNRPLDYVTQIYPNVRVLVMDGVAVDRANTLNPQRINIATRNNYVTGFLGVY